MAIEEDLRRFHDERNRPQIGNDRLEGLYVPREDAVGHNYAG